MLRPVLPVFVLNLIFHQYRLTMPCSAWFVFVESAIFVAAGLECLTMFRTLLGVQTAIAKHCMPPGAFRNYLQTHLDTYMLMPMCLGTNIANRKCLHSGLHQHRKKTDYSWNLKSEHFGCLRQFSFLRFLQRRSINLNTFYGSLLCFNHKQSVNWCRTNLFC